MFRRLKDRVLLLGTLLFAVHPIHTEAVSGIVGRAELMCFVFYLGTIRVYCSICAGLSFRIFLFQTRHTLKRT